ncbi:MAG: hypothetical protein EBS00_04815, partial [Verrucomicrobia bacterium]|nr:hypothetical protein [Verrucomicrobiota bacterium]
MPAPARKRSTSLARPASESRPLLAVTLALVGAFLLVALLFHDSRDVYLFPEWIEKTFSLPIDSSVALENNPCGA